MACPPHVKSSSILTCMALEIHKPMHEKGYRDFCTHCLYHLFMILLGLACCGTFVFLSPVTVSRVLRCCNLSACFSLFLPMQGSNCALHAPCSDDSQSIRHLRFSCSAVRVKYFELTLQLSYKYASSGNTMQMGMLKWKGFWAEIRLQFKQAKKSARLWRQV